MNYPRNQPDSTWATKSGDVTFYVPVDMLAHVKCRIKTAGNTEMILTLDYGAGMAYIDPPEATIKQNGYHEKDRVEEWENLAVGESKYTVRVEETTYFTPGEILTFYCVDGNHLDDPEYLQAEIAKIQREERKSQWIARGIFAGVVVLVVAIVVLLLRRKRRRRKLG